MFRILQFYLIYSTLDLSPLRKKYSYKIKFKLIKFRIRGLQGIGFIFHGGRKKYRTTALKIYLWCQSVLMCMAVKQYIFKCI